MGTTLIGSETIQPNPGGKRCRICKALILDERVVGTRTSWRHLGCYPAPRQRGTKGQLSSLSLRESTKGRRVNRSKYLGEE